MTDIPDIPLEQIQQRVVAMWMGSFYGSSGYVARKLGKKGLREFQEHLGGELTITLLAGIGVGVEVHEIDPARMRDAAHWLKAHAGR